MDRRDLLKAFGVGTIISPVANLVQARIIEPPKVELVVPETISTSEIMSNMEAMGVEIRVKLPSGTYLWDCKAVMVNHTVALIDITQTLDGPYRRYLPGPIVDATFRVSGGSTQLIKIG